ncbi:MAG TPA: CHAD domain-containing protein [Candidatus Hydrogenedens sp.]|nr:CHAD domain-containing protein [Candidatus Hydrogenedens sp.]
MQKEGEEISCPKTREIFISYYNLHLDGLKTNLPLLLTYNPDAIHDVRVATRRMRAVLNECKKWLPSDIKYTLATQLRTITRSLSKRRELDVIQQVFEHLLINNKETFYENFILDFSNYINKLRENEVKNCSIAYNTSLEILNYPPLEEHLKFPSDFCIYPYAKKRVLSSITKIKRGTKSIQNVKSPMNETVHIFRILIKKIRYMWEIYHYIFQSPLQNFSEHLKTTQTLLGDYNDFRILSLLLKDFNKQTNQAYSQNISKIRDDLKEKMLKKINEAENAIENVINTKNIKNIKQEIKEICNTHICIS